MTIKKELRASVLLIEHDMPLIMGVSDRLDCLETGQVIAEGEPEQVRNDPEGRRQLSGHRRAGDRAQWRDDARGPGPAGIVRAGGEGGDGR